jgi:anti-sigma factor RsiW
MKEDLHIRAQMLFAKSLVEGLPNGEQSWLDQHLHECAACARETASTHELVHALRNASVSVPHDLATRTQLRLRLQESVPASQGRYLLWVITGFSWLVGVLSAPLVWRGFTWVGNHLHVPMLALEMGFVLWWVVPALFAVAAVLHQRGRNLSPSRGQN